MSATRSGDSPRGTWWHAVLLLAGLALLSRATRPLWNGYDFPESLLRLVQSSRGLLLLLGLVLTGWGFRSGGLRWLWSIPATVMAYAIGGGYRQARHYEARLTREALVYTLFMIVVLLGSLLGHSNMLLLVFALMAGAFVLNGQVTLSVISRTRVRRILPEMAFAGEPCAVRIELANRKPLMPSWMIVVEDAVTHHGEALNPVVLFERVPARSSREASYQVTPGQRGVMRFDHLRIASRYPLGLWERSYEVAVADELLVFPRIGRLTSRYRDSQRAQQRSEFDAPARSGMFDEEFHRLREFRSGDSRRSIHWRTTARRNELMVREYQEQHNPELLLVLELWLPDRPSAADLSRVETAVSFAATCCVERARNSLDTGVQLVVCSREGLAVGETGAGVPLRSALETLAVVAGTASPDWGHAYGILRQRALDPCRKVLVTTRPASAGLRMGSAESDAALSGCLESFETIGSDESPVVDYLDLFEPREGAG